MPQVLVTPENFSSAPMNADTNANSGFQNRTADRQRTRQQLYFAMNRKRFFVGLQRGQINSRPWVCFTGDIGRAGQTSGF